MQNKNNQTRLTALPIPVASSVILAMLLIGMAMADPGGLFAVMPWTGGNPVAALWWWAPYVLFLPLMLALYFLGVRTIVNTASANVTHRRLAIRSWLLIIPVTVIAWFINATLTLYLSLPGNTYVLATAGTLSWLLWAGGYAALKMALLGWLPALPVWFSRRGDTLPVHGGETIASGTSWAAAGIGTVLLSILTGWVLNTWQAGPLAYIGGEVPALLTSVATGTFAVLIYLLVSVGIMRQCELNSSGAGLFAVGARSGVVATLLVLTIQIVCATIGVAMGSRTDAWFIPLAILLACQAMSLALVAAVCNGLALLVAQRLPGGASRSVAVISVIAATAALALHGHPNAGPQTNSVHADQGDAVMVRHDADLAVLSNRRGAQLLLRGVNVNQLGEYYQANRNLAAAQPLARQDFVDMAALGINAVRLTLSWSLLEPERGRISSAYLAQISQAVDWAAEQHIYVVLDIHQDAWGMSVVGSPSMTCRPGASPMTGWDGAPLWATFTDGAPACQFTGRDLAPNVSRAFQSFYMDREAIQSHLVSAWATLATRFAANPDVVGYDLLNEPNFAETPPVSSTLLLTNFYARAIAAIRHAEKSSSGGFTHPVLIEPSIFWSGFGVDNLPPSGTLDDGQLVFAPHLYNESITSDQDLGVNLISIERGFRLARAAANQLHAALWIGEWGWFGDSPQQAPLWQRQAAAEDAGQIGSALWIWKQACGDPHVYPGPFAGNVWRADCPGNVPNRIDPQARKILQRPYLRLAPGRIDQFGLTPDTLTFSGRRSNPQLGDSCDLQLWVPGSLQPQADVMEGIASITWQRIAPGSAALGNSGGWILHGCATGDRYHASLRWHNAD